eukprot:UN14138
MTRLRVWHETNRNPNSPFRKQSTSIVCDRNARNFTAKNGLVEKYQDIHGVWEMKEAQKLNTQLTEENASLRLTVDELESKIEDLQSVVDTLEGKFQEAKSETVQPQDRFHALKDERLDYQEELDCFQDGLKALQKR